MGCFSPKIWLAPSTSSRAARSFKNCPRPGLRQCFAANLWIMGVFPGLMSYQRASRGYQISTSGVLQVPFVAPTPLRRCWRQASVFSCRSVVGCCWAWLESHSNNTSNYSIAQLLFLKWLTHDDSMTQEVKMMAMDGQMAIIFLEIFALCD